MNKALVSVIMPAYNAEKFIGESIESVINQTYKNWELLIVDDGSIDKTKDIIQDFCIKDPRIKYYYQQNGRQGKARNLALQNAAGTYVAFLDSDDIWLPQKLSVQVQEIHKNNVDLVFSEARIFSNNFSDPGSLMNSGKGIFKGNNALKDFLEQNKIPILTVLIKAEALRSVYGFSEIASIQNAEDYHLWLRLLIAGKTFYGSEHVLAGYREHAFSSTLTDKLSVPKVVEVLEDLKLHFKIHKSLIKSFQKKWFKQYHYSTSHWNKSSYKKLIAQNCAYINKRSYNLPFQAIYSFFGLRITRKLITKILNNSSVITG